MTKGKAGKKAAAEVKWDDLVFEVGCLGCGETSFTLPYEKDTFDIMTCQQCGEVTIAHVLPEGGIATATLAQREQAREEWMSEIEEYLGTLTFAPYDGDSYLRSNSSTLSGKALEVQWTHLAGAFDGKVRISDNEAFGLLSVRVTTEVKGLVGTVKLEASHTRASGSRSLRCDGYDLTPLNERLLVGRVRFPGEEEDQQ